MLSYFFKALSPTPLPLQNSKAWKNIFLLTQARAKVTLDFFIIVCSVSSRPQYVFMRSCLRQKKIAEIINVNIMWLLVCFHNPQWKREREGELFFSFESDVYACYKPCIVSFPLHFFLSLSTIMPVSQSILFFDW